MFASAAHLPRGHASAPPRRLEEPTKNLSVNYVDGERYLAEGDDGCGEMVERNEAAFEFLVPHEQLAKAIEPAVADLNHPSPGLLVRVAPLSVGLLAAIDDMRK